uniref:hypothetical protein n=1 Tax=Clostridium perfringens TaxID=1502 RepID=UPI00396B1130
MQIIYLNTYHVKVQSQAMVENESIAGNLNTYHVKVQFASPPVGGSGAIPTFKYIPC